MIVPKKFKKKKRCCFSFRTKITMLTGFYNIVWNVKYKRKTPVFLCIINFEAYYIVFNKNVSKYNKEAISY